MPHDDQLYALSERQHGSLATRQAHALGLTYDEVDHLMDSGEWERVTGSVIRRVGSPRSRGQRVMEAVLDAGEGAALSHTSDAAWWRLRGFRLNEIEVARRRNTRSQPARLADIIHEPRLLPRHHRTVLDGVPVIVPSRIPFDLAATRPWLAEKALDRAWAANLLSYTSVTRMLRELATRGRPGITQMRELIEDRGPDYRPNDTNLEDRFQQLAREAGWDDFERQHQVLGREWLGRVDFLSRRRRLIIEVDSAFCHGALIDRRLDAARRRALEADGYRVEAFTDSEIWFDPAGTVRRLRALRSGS